MARTINPQIEIFNNVVKATKYFDNQTEPCQLLESIVFGKATWFVDKSKQAIVEWPKHYTIINEK
jgi:hypothetical protein